jgi:tetratricopeptide (TPR) repeat protein
MSKKHTKKKQAPPVPAKVARDIDRAFDLLQRRQWEEAQHLLETIIRRHPSETDALSMLGQVYLETHNHDALWDVTEKLVKMEPGQPESWYNAMGAGISNGLPFLARHYGQHFVSTWPNHPSAENARELLVSLEQACEEILVSPDTEPGATAAELMLLEETQMLIRLGRYIRAEKVVAQALKALPDAAAPRNNLSLIYALQGKMEPAIRVAKEVLDKHPNNVHALANLVQFLVRSGNKEEATQFAQILRAQPPTTEEAFAKHLEAFSFLGDNAAVVHLYESFRKNGFPGTSFICHLAAVAYARQGRDKQARQLWELALKLEPGFALARTNLNDLKLPSGEKHGAWPFPFNHWLPVAWIERLEQAMVRGERSDQAAKREVERLLRELPGMAALLPILLERGDPEGRAIALNVAYFGELPLLKEFAVSPYGPDQLRLEAAQKAVMLGLLPRGQETSMYIKGQQQPIMLMGYEIYWEPSGPMLPDKAQDLLEECHERITQGRFADVEKLAREALALAPDNPTLLNYLGIGLKMTGKVKESIAVIQRTLDLYPDYVFARCQLAEVYIDQGRLTEAHELLDPLLTMERFHISEFRSICGTYAILLTAEKKFDGAESWLQMWQNAEPDNSNINALRKQLRRKGLR